MAISFILPTLNKQTVVPLEENTTNPFLPDTPFGRRPNYWAIDTSTYEQPRWYSETWGWIAFYDKTALSTSSPLFRTLEFSNVHCMPEPDNGFIGKWMSGFDSTLRNSYAIRTWIDASWLYHTT